MTHAAAAAAHRWTRWYWPAAVTLSVVLFTAASYIRLTGWGLLAGVVLIVPVELWMVATRDYAATLSDWIWGVLGVMRTQPVAAWSAKHFLALGAYLLLAFRADAYLWHLGWLAFGTGLILSVWLTWHLFSKKWR